MKKLKLLALALSVALFTLPLAHAHEDGDANEKESCDMKCHECHDCHDHSEHHSRFSVSLAPEWDHVTRNNYANAFTNNGFASPSKERSGMSVLAYWTTDSAWQLGFGFGGLTAGQDNGTSQASYNSDYFGFYFAKNFTPGQNYDITLGSMLGAQTSVLEVFSSTQNGKLEEGAAMVAPTIGYAYRVGNFVKLGLKASYLFPFAESSTIHGQNLGVDKISARAFALGVQVIIGRF